MAVARSPRIVHAKNCREQIAMHGIFHAPCHIRNHPCSPNTPVRQNPRAGLESQRAGDRVDNPCSMRLVPSHEWLVNAGVMDMDMDILLRKAVQAVRTQKRPLSFATRQIAATRSRIPHSYGVWRFQIFMFHFFTV